MPEISVSIGGREFPVACQPGEEPYLQAAASMLDAEASDLLQQVGRMPTDKMLLLAGLMLADKIAAMEEDLTAKTEALSAAEHKLAERAREVADLRDRAEPTAVAVIPGAVRDHLAELAARAEALADELEAEPGPG
ncbi:cell division protein ZapA [Rhodobacterales bacterium HKCCE2091]|nr:cell division protein ZapA [Rhodobacterales bacterium HKCCE2091]